MQKYVWFDDITQHERTRLDVRAPKPLVEFLRQVAKKNGVSLNSLVTGILTYAADAESHRRLCVVKVPDVRVTDKLPEGSTVDVPATPVSAWQAGRWRIPNVL